MSLLSRMGKILKSGRINFDNSTSDRAYPHALVAGLDRYPRKITRRMPKRKQKKMLRMKPFVKVANYTHLLPTRYVLDSKFNTKKVNKEALRDKELKRKAKDEVRSKLQERLMAGKNFWFFTKFRF
ncbi:hypothetical protein GJ496_012037 [Pomphorhynchus laevis]|nr:hypothetical protein GJ496_012037 [Pomphorhynchus laevis]